MLYYLTGSSLQVAPAWYLSAIFIWLSLSYFFIFGLLRLPSWIYRIFGLWRSKLRAGRCRCGFWGCFGLWILCGFISSFRGSRSIGIIMCGGFLNGSGGRRTGRFILHRNRISYHPITFYLGCCLKVHK